MEWDDGLKDLVGRRINEDGSRIDLTDMRTESDEPKTVVISPALAAQGCNTRFSEAQSSKREDFVYWLDAACRDAIPDYPEDFTRKQLVDYAFDVLWNRMEKRGGIIPPDDSIPGDGVSKGESA